MRLYRELDVPDEFRSVLEDLNAADTAARYPDTDDLDIETPAETIAEIEELLQWIERQSAE